MTKGYEQRKKANEKYLAKLDEIKVRVPNGIKDKWKDAAAMRGLSLNQFIVEAVEQEIEKAWE